ncbi:MAG: hypothetical protein AAF620_09855 [Bacteroidota bacterium]
MNQLTRLLEIAKTSNYVMIVDDEYQPIKDNLTGTIMSVKGRILYELFGEYPLSPENETHLLTLLKTKFELSTKPLKRRRKTKKNE